MMKQCTKIYKFINITLNYHVETMVHKYLFDYYERKRCTFYLKDSRSSRVYILQTILVIVFHHVTVCWLFKKKKKKKKKEIVPVSHFQYFCVKLYAFVDN